MEANTRGTTMQNIMLMNTVPRGFSTEALGHTQPTMAPATMAMSITAIKR